MVEPTGRPAVWVGHILVAATDIARSADFYVSLGMREVERNSRVAVLELRGGTHLVVVAGEAATAASFDLMVDDIDEAHARWTSLGLSPADVQRGSIHDTFTVVDPVGTVVTINSSHVMGDV